MQSLSRQASKRQHASLKRSDVIKFIGNFLFDIIIAAPKRTVTLAPAPPLSFPSPSPDAVIKGNYLHRHSSEQSKQGVAPNRRSRLGVSLQFSLPHSINLYLTIYLSIYLLRLFIPSHCVLRVDTSETENKKIKKEHYRNSVTLLQTIFHLLGIQELMVFFILEFVYCI